MKLAFAAAIVLAFPASAQAHKHHVRRHHTHHVRESATIAAPALPAAAPGAIAAPRGPWAWLGNETVGDCTFVAAANWEIITQHAAPVESELLTEFHEAGGSDVAGLPAEALAAYWGSHGILGVKASLTRHSPGELETLVRGARAVMAVIHIYAGEVFQPVGFRSGVDVVEDGPQTMTTTLYHFVVVAGFNATGPQIITWTRTFQLTWAEWNASAPEIYLPERQSQ